MTVFISVLSAVCLVAVSLECFRVLQATGYRPQRGYIKLLISWYFLSLAVVEALAVALYLCAQYAIYYNFAIYVLLAVGCNLFKRKSPIKITKRVWRMLAVQFILLVLTCILLDAVFCVIFLPLFTLVSWAICLPIDLLVAQHYIAMAQSKLVASGVKVVAITGSYGKTSVKDMLAALLCDSIAPGGSCNTPLGIASFINTTDLSGFSYLVLEFGARRRGDIAQLCRLYKPTYGVVTGVCEQHLSTFHTLDNIIATKRELVENLPKNGFCVLNANDSYAVSFCETGCCPKYLSYDGLQIQLESINFEGSRFSVQIGSTGSKICLPQISEHTADTLAMCIQAVTCLGQNVDTTLARIVNVKQTPHRLQLMQGANCHILDDSYNGSTVGVASCCRTLAHFNCTKVVITQGLVECGCRRKQLNIECGQMLGNSCDVAVVLGRNAKYLSEGLQNTSCKVYLAKNLTEAVQIANKYVNGGILIFQNDLPDVANI